MLEMVSLAGRAYREAWRAAAGAAARADRDEPATALMKPISALKRNMLRYRRRLANFQLQKSLRHPTMAVSDALREAGAALAIHAALVIVENATATQQHPRSSH